MGLEPTQRADTGDHISGTAQRPNPSLPPLPLYSPHNPKLPLFTFPFYYNHPLLPLVLPPISERKEMGGKWDGSRKLSAVDKNPREFSQSRELPSGGLISLSLTPSHLLPQCMCVCEQSLVLEQEGRKMHFRDNLVQNLDC